VPTAVTLPRRYPAAKSDAARSMAVAARPTAYARKAVSRLVVN